MHVGLNLVYLVPGATGGMETYARELIPELVAAAPEDRFTAFVSREGAAVEGPWHDLDACVVVPVNSSNRVAWVRGEQQLLPPLARRAGVELLHSFASTAPAWGRFRRVTTIHDLIYRLVPQAHPGLRSLGMRVLVPLAARRSDRIIVDATSTKSDLQRLLVSPRQGRCRPAWTWRAPRHDAAARGRTAPAPRRRPASDRAQRLGQARPQEPGAPDWSRRP